MLAPTRVAPVLVRRMPVEKKPQDAGLSDADKKRTTVTVRGYVQRLVAKIASHRGISIEALFEQEDVLTFFRHLLIEEMRKETLLLQGGDGKPEVKQGKK